MPNLFRDLTLLPRVLEAAAILLDALLLKQSPLTRVQKETVLLALAAECRNSYCATLHSQSLRLFGVSAERVDTLLTAQEGIRHPSGLPESDIVLLETAVKFAGSGALVGRDDVAGLPGRGLPAEEALDLVLTAALGNFLCTLSAGLATSPDFAPLRLPPASRASRRLSNRPAAPGATHGPYLPLTTQAPESSAVLDFFRDNFGYLPNVFRAQAGRPDALNAEAAAFRGLLLPGGVLTRVQKEFILLAVSAANANDYFVAAHGELLRTLGVPLDSSDQIAEDHRRSSLGDADKKLLDFAVSLAARPAGFNASGLDLLRQAGFRDEQILEAAAMAAFTSFLNTIQAGLGVVPDFTPRRALRLAARENSPHPLAAESRHISEEPFADPDGELVEGAQKGDLKAFEELVRRHGRRVYRTLVGILGDPEEARDAMQDTFLKAFQHLGRFERRSKFSTWLVSIATTTGVQRLRDRKSIESLDASAESEEGFRPRLIQAWSDNPEQVYAKAELRATVEANVRRLPAKYRVAVVLRDIEQLSTEEAAAALGIGIPALKARLFRGRLMLREALASHFTGATGAAI